MYAQHGSAEELLCACRKEKENNKCKNYYQSHVHFSTLSVNLPNKLNASLPSHIATCLRIGYSIKTVLGFSVWKSIY